MSFGIELPNWWVVGGSSVLGRLTTMESYQFGIELPIDFEVMVFADLEVGGGLFCVFFSRKAHHYGHCGHSDTQNV